MNPFDPHAHAPPPWSSAPPPPYAYTPPRVAPPAQRTVAGVVATVFVVLALAATVLALVNLSQLGDLAAKDDKLPEWIRAIMFNGSLTRVRLWGGGGTLLGMVGLALALVGRRSIVGKMALGLASLGLAGSLFAQVSSAAYTHMPETRPSERAAAAAEAPAAPLVDDGVMSPADSSQQSAFRLGNKLAASTLGRANRADPRAVAGVLGKARLAASELGAPLPEPPPLTGPSAEDNAAALHWLLGDAGKPIWRHLEKKYDARHGALFELGIKLEILRLMHADPEMQRGLVESVQRLAVKGGVAGAVEGVVTLSTGASDADVGARIDATIKRLDDELGRVKSAAKTVALARKPAPANVKPRAAAAPKGAPKRGNGGISDADRYVVTVTR